MNRKKKCTRCSKLKTLSRFNEIDYGWGKFKKSSWCKVCDSWMNRKRVSCNKKWIKLQAHGKIILSPIIGRSEDCKGWYAADKGWRTNGKPSNYI